MSEITLRNLPDHVEKAIRKRADEKRISLNQSATEHLQQALGTAEGRGKYRDLQNRAGTWGEDEAAAFGRRIDEMRSIDPEIWK